jgi:hypothetical protein
LDYLLHHYSKISAATKELVLVEIVRMVEACEGDEDVMKRYHGNNLLRNYLSDDLRADLSAIQFDESTLIWHFATDVFLFFYVQEHAGTNDDLVEATKAISNYMMFLLVKDPSMLPSPVRSRLYVNARPKLRSLTWILSFKEGLFRSFRYGDLRREEEFISDQDPDLSGEEHGPRVTSASLYIHHLPKTLDPGARLAKELLSLPNMTEVLKVVFQVWVEKLSYAAHHCSRDAHARRLNNGGGALITVVWLLTSAVFKSLNSDKIWFRLGAQEFFQSRLPVIEPLSRLFEKNLQVEVQLHAASAAFFADVCIARGGILSSTVANTSIYLLLSSC